MRLKALLLILCYEICSMLGQVAFKKSARKFSTFPLVTLRDHLIFLRQVMRIPGIWWGIFIIACGTVGWLVALAHVDLSVAIPLDGMHYLVVLAGSYIFLRERLTWTRVLGTFLIVGGITLVALS